MRTCPTCHDYYADESLDFCLNDGAPLAGVDPSGDEWNDAARIIKETEDALKQRRRKVKRRRILFNSMTMLMATLIVFVIAVNGFIYLKPEPEGTAGKAEEPFREVAAKAPSVTVPPGKSTPTRVPWPVGTPLPSATPTVTAGRPKPTPQPSPRTTTVSIEPTPIPSPVASVCTDADKTREREAIVRSFGETWRRSIEGERQRIISENAPARAANTEATLGALEYNVAFFNFCRAVTVTARYAWQLRSNVNGTIKVSSVAKERRFACMKIGGAWLCR